jgi:hypothetical protein
MSVYFVAQWTIPEGKKEACEEALKAILAHIQVEHPAIRSVRVFRQIWGPVPRRAYVWYEEYESLTALDQEVGTPQCDEVWAPIYAMAQEGTFLTGLWSDLQRDLWMQR